MLRNGVTGLDHRKAALDKTFTSRRAAQGNTTVLTANAQDSALLSQKNNVYYM